MTDDQYPGDPGASNPHPDGSETARTDTTTVDAIPTPEDTAAATRATRSGSRRSARRASRSTNRIVGEWAILIVGALVIAVLIKTFVFQAFWIPSGSMLPTLQVDDRVLVNKLSYTFNDPERGDIVVFDAPPVERTQQIKDLVKRIIGLPGEVISMQDGVVSIDGRTLVEPYVKNASTKSFAACRVPAGAYFMMGDNRDVSADSRVFGPIKGSTIVGRVFIRIWPLSQIGFMSDGPPLGDVSPMLVGARPHRSGADESVPVCVGSAEKSAATSTNLAT